MAETFFCNALCRAALTAQDSLHPHPHQGPCSLCRALVPLCPQICPEESPLCRVLLWKCSQTVCTTSLSHLKVPGLLTCGKRSWGLLSPMVPTWSCPPDPMECRHVPRQSFETTAQSLLAACSQGCTLQNVPLRLLRERKAFATTPALPVIQQSPNLIFSLYQRHLWLFRSLGLNIFHLKTDGQEGFSLPCFKILGLDCGRPQEQKC